MEGSSGGWRFGAREFWQTVRLLGSCALAYGAAALIGLPDRFWAPITAVVVTQQAFDATLSAARDRIVGTMLGALAGLGVILAARQGLPLQPTFWAALVPLAALTAVWPTLRLSCITLMVVLLVPPITLSFARPLDRVLEIILGTLASIAVSAAVFPGQKNSGK